jgi:DNA-binding NarL/FixJ family response regulator
MSKVIQILIADDHPIVRQGLRQTIESEGGDLEIVAETGDGAEALAAARRFRTAIIILDIDLPKLCARKKSNRKSFS